MLQNILLFIFLAFNSLSFPSELHTNKPATFVTIAALAPHIKANASLSNRQAHIPHVYLRAPQTDNQALILLPNIALIGTIKYQDYLQIFLQFVTKKTLQWHQQTAINGTSLQRAPPQLGLLI